MPVSKKEHVTSSLYNCEHGKVTTFFVRQFADRFSQFTGFLWRVEDLIVEDGEVKCQAQADGMCGVHLSLADVKRFLVCLL